jgi:hypothetical protein
MTLDSIEDVDIWMNKLFLKYVDDYFTNIWKDLYKNYLFGGVIINRKRIKNLYGNFKPKQKWLK